MFALADQSSSSSTSSSSSFVPRTTHFVTSLRASYPRLYVQSNNSISIRIRGSSYQSSLTQKQMCVTCLEFVRTFAPICFCQILFFVYAMRTCVLLHFFCSILKKKILAFTASIFWGPGKKNPLSISANVYELDETFLANRINNFFFTTGRFLHGEWI